MTPQQIKDAAPEGATHYCKTTNNMFYLRWINRDLYRTVGNEGSKFFVDTKQYEIKPL